MSDWPPAQGETLGGILLQAGEIRERVRKGLDPYPPRNDKAEMAGPTVAAIWSRYIGTHSSDKRPSTIANDERLWRLYLERVLGSKRPSDLTFDVVKRWYSAVAAKSVVNASRSFKLLKAVLNAAKYRWKEPWARENPLDILRGQDRKANG